MTSKAARWHWHRHKRSGAGGSSRSGSDADNLCEPLGDSVPPDHSLPLVTQATIEQGIDPGEDRPSSRFGPPRRRP